MNQKEIREHLRSLVVNEGQGDNNFELIVDPFFDGYRPDFILKIGEKNIAAIDIISTNKLGREYFKFSPELYFLLKIRYFVFTDGVTFDIYDRFDNQKESVRTNSEGFVSKIKRKIKLENLQKLKNSVSKIFEEEINECHDKFPKLSEFIGNHRDNIVNELKLSSSFDLFFEGGKTDVQSFEHQFFVKLLENDVPDVVYRYCSFHRAFKILNEGKIAMLGLPGMNDTTEPNYTENYINDSDQNYWELPPQSITAINSRFIMSCTIHHDNLLQWRLYGDDAKGACIKFKTKTILKTSQRFYIGKVKYADHNNQHPELSLIKKIRQRIREELFFDLKFVLLYVWRHFFKPKEYAHEGEVRLLYIHRKNERQKQWIIAEPYSIVNPMVIFDLHKDKFPLKITEVMLGPKRAERQVNRAQLRQMLAETKKIIQVTESKRNVYR